VRLAYPFIAGIAVYRALDALPRNSPSLRQFLLVAALFTLALTLTIADRFGGLYESAIALFGVLAALHVGARLQLRGTTRRIACWLGAISYPLHATHYPFVRIFSRTARAARLDHGAAPFAVIALEIIVALAFAAVVVRHVEPPLRRWLGRIAFAPHAPQAPAAILRTPP